MGGHFEYVTYYFLDRSTDFESNEFFFLQTCQNEGRLAMLRDSFRSNFHAKRPAEACFLQDNESCKGVCVCVCVSVFASAEAGAARESNELVSG
jgi:hypothetical protein